jgi:hypothetical protein
MRHVGIELGKTIEDTLRETVQKIKTKALKWRIFTMTQPTDILHRATLINTAMILLDNHILWLS